MKTFFVEMADDSMSPRRLEHHIKYFNDCGIKITEQTNIIEILTNYDRGVFLFIPPAEYDMDDLAEEFNLLGLSPVEHFFKWLVEEKGFIRITFKTVKHPFG